MSEHEFSEKNTISAGFFDKLCHENHREIGKLSICASFYLKNSAMRLDSICFFE